MAAKLVQTNEVQDYLKLVSGLTNTIGKARVKQIVHRIVSDLFQAIEDLEITPEEFWTGVSYINDLGAAGEASLLAPGLGLEHFLDMRLDAEDEESGAPTGTPRTIEGPLYVGGAPLVAGHARLDDATEQGDTLIMHGIVRSVEGNPIPGALVDVWHANTKGLYSGFDKSQSEYNLRRRVQTDDAGGYEFRTIMPSGYGCPPEGPTQALLNAIGRHGRRPAHIHFFVSAPGYRHLTTQINISGDPYLYDDFAFATRDGLVPEIIQCRDEKSIRERGLEAHFLEIEFDFVLRAAPDHAAEQPIPRRRLVLA
jgi:catechol 1,2-dioxygenase